MTIQHAVGDGAPTLFHVWREPVGDTLHLIEKHVNHPGGVVGFNLTFDWFHLQKAYNVLSLVSNKDSAPVLAEVIEVEHAGVEGPCLKPVTALDLMLHAYRGPFQSLMERDDVVVRKVPRVLGEPLAEHLNSTLDLPGIYFAKRGGKRWEVEELKPAEDHLVNVRLVFAATAGLKPLIAHLTGADTLDYPVPEYLRPREPEWYPFHDKSNPRSWGHLLMQNVLFWASDTIAQRYALEDVYHTRKLYQLFGRPEMGDYNSLLACAVASMRWRGYVADMAKCCAVRAESHALSLAAPTAPGEVKRLLLGKMSATEALGFQDTSGDTLEAITDWGPDHPAAVTAKAVIAARTADKQVNMLDKFIKLNGRVHFGFRVIGTLSDRMSGDNKLNPHGVDREGPIRKALPLCREGDVLSGGDFDSYEIMIADAVYNDPELRKELKSGKKLYGMFGEELYDVAYDEVLRSKGAEVDMYDRAKHSVLGMLYGAMEKKVAKTAGVPQEQGDQAVQQWYLRFPGVAAARKRISDRFCSMRQPGGMGTNVEWHEPAEHVESLLGFKRYYTLENKLCRLIFDLAQKPPKAWKDLKVRLIRQPHRGIQTAGGAVMSALFAAAFQIQARNMRTAANHEIQSTGANITKGLQLELWGLQPQGIHAWRVQPFNAHDEVMCPHQAGLDLKPVVEETIIRYRKVVPLLNMPWKERLPSWGDK